MDERRSTVRLAVALVVVGVLGPAIQPAAAVTSPTTSAAVAGAGTARGVPPAGPDRRAVQPAVSGTRPGVAIDVARSSSDRSVVRFRVTLSVPEGHEAVALRIGDATVTGTEGFERTGDSGTFEWDGTTETPTLTFALDVADLGRSYAATAEWVFGPTPTIRVAWVPSGGNEWTTAEPLIATDYDRVDVDVAGRGVVGGGFFYLGPYTDHVVRGSSQRLRLVVPRAADLPRSPDAILTAILNASAYMVGTEHDRILIFAVPDPVREGGASYSRAGEFWVHASSRLATPDNVWFHEFMHTRQVYRTTASMEWFVEASAVYHATLLTHHQGRISAAAARRHLTRDRFRSAVLSRPDTWSSKLVPYYKGPAVLYLLDRKIRHATNGEKWLGNVIYRMHRHDGPVSYRDFRAMVVAVAGPAVGEWLGTYVTTSAWPDRLDSGGPGLPGGRQGQRGGATPTGTAPTVTTAADETETATAPAAGNGAEPATTGAAPGFGVVAALGALGLLSWSRRRSDG